MPKRVLFLSLLLFTICAGQVLAQGLDTNAKKDDWEEINFEFDSDILSDGYPSLLRLAELLNKNPDYKVLLSGHTDFRGSDAYNVELGRRRAEMVRSFLVKYGARQEQINVETEGKGQPEVSNNTNEGRFMNRRVVLTILNMEPTSGRQDGVGAAP